MRTVIPIILRLLADSKYPQALRGTLQTLEQEDPIPFSDEQELLRLLRRLIVLTFASPDDSGRSPNEE